MKKTIKKELQPIDIHFDGHLRDEQERIISDVYKHIKNKNGIVLSLPCGFGKTVIAINLISKLKLKTLVIVHIVLNSNIHSVHINGSNGCGYYSPTKFVVMTN